MSRISSQYPAIGTAYITSGVGIPCASAGSIEGRSTSPLCGGAIRSIGGRSLDETRLHRHIQAALDKGCFKALLDVCPITYTYVVYDQFYRLGKPIVSDQQFDSFEDMIKDRWPDNPALQRVGGLLEPQCYCCSNRLEVEKESKKK